MSLIITAVFARFAFYPSLVYGKAMEKFADRKWYTRIDDTVILGALPFKSMSEKLIEDEGVKALVTLNENHELKRFVHSKKKWAEFGVEQKLLPTTDIIGAPSLEDTKEIVEFIQDYRRENKGSVYVHCKAGRTRSALVVLCYLMKEYNMNPESSMEFLSKKRPQVLLRKPQHSALMTFYQDLTSSKTS